MAFKDHRENSAEGQNDKAEAVKADTSTKQAQTQADEDQARGFRGVEVDPIDNEAYTVAGVTSGMPTPETDDDAHEKARKAQADTSRQSYGAAER